MARQSSVRHRIAVATSTALRGQIEAILPASRVNSWLANTHKADKPARTISPRAVWLAKGRARAVFEALVEPRDVCVLWRLKHRALYTAQEVVQIDRLYHVTTNAQTLGAQHIASLAQACHHDDRGRAQ